MNMIFWLYGFCFHLWCILVPVKSLTADLPVEIQHEFPELGLIENGAIHHRELQTKFLEKRATSAAAKGLSAVEKLLSGAQKARTTSTKYRLYTKHGGINTAINDFQSVKPKLYIDKVEKHRRLSNFSRGKRTQDVLVGSVGDRRLILLRTGDMYSKYKPVLEIRPATDALYDRIVYQMD